MSRRYNVGKCVGFEVGESSGGFPQITLDLMFVEDGNGRKIGEKTKDWIILSDHPDAGKWAVEKLRALGMTNDDVTKPEGLGSTKATIVEEMSTYEGKSRWRVRFINAFKERGEKQEASQEVHDALSAKLMAAFQEVPAIEVTEANRAPESIEPAQAEAIPEDF